MILLDKYRTESINYFYYNDEFFGVYNKEKFSKYKSKGEG